MQDIEFTIQEGKLYMLQCRNGKRTGTAALNMAMDMLKEGLIDEKTCRDARRSRPSWTSCCTRSSIRLGEKKATAVVSGLPAGPGGARGQIVFTSPRGGSGQAGKKVILVREETNPEDVEGMRAAEGILTARGGMTSHAALVARGWGKCCIVGAGEMKIDMATKTL
jgi:pyruvate,orthophosphate dikinase